MKHKKKPTSHEKQKIIAAQYRNDFFSKMKLIIDTCCGKNIYPLIPQKILDYTYLCRNSPFKFRADSNSNISSTILTDSKVILTHVLKNQNIILPPNNLEITIYEYYTVMFTIASLNSIIKDINFKDIDIVKNALNILVNDSETNDHVNQSMHNILYYYNIGLNNLKQNLYWYHHQIIPPLNFPNETENVITIHSIIPETIAVEIDNNTRPAIRVGWAFPITGPQWISINPSILGVNSPFAEIPVNVYIQSHALNRLLERVDCFEVGMIQFNIYVSLLLHKVTIATNKNILIEFSILGIKVGYFRTDIIDGIILIRTFLFITNNGTPEGQLLEKNTGLQKFDKKYLALDKLSTFMASDIDKNEEVRQIFKSSGCQCLLDLYEKMKPIVTKTSDHFNSELILNYLNTNNSNYTVPLSETQLHETNI